MRNSVCYAYYADNKFIGWYADSFGSIRPNSPKIYGDSTEQNDIIKKNFLYKIQKLKEKSNIPIETNPIGLTILNDSLDNDKEILKKSKNIELRVVLCPFYDGPNINYNKEVYRNWVKQHDIKDKVPQEIDFWVYADYSKVKEWASKEPIEFLFTIKAE